MKILVIGASSGIGLATVKEALENGLAVRAFSRSAEKSMTLSHDLLETRSGNALNAEDIRAALCNVDAVVQVLGVPLNLKLITGPISLFSEATKVLLPSMHDAGVKRLIGVTGFGAGESRTAISPVQRLPFRAVFGRAYDDKSIQETMIKSSGLDWTIVRPGVLTNGPKTQRYRVLVNATEWSNGIISRANVAHFIVQELKQSALIGADPVIIR